MGAGLALGRCTPSRSPRRRPACSDCFRRCRSRAATCTRRSRKAHAATASPSRCCAAHSSSLQVAFALVSLVGALLFVRTFMNLGGSELGFDTQRLMTMRFYFSGDQSTTPPDAKLHRVEDIVRRVEALPGVQAAFASNFVPLAMAAGAETVDDRRAPRPGGRERAASRLSASRRISYATLGDRDTGDVTSAMRKAGRILRSRSISQAMAKRFWPGGDPIGGRFRVAGDRRRSGSRSSASRRTSTSTESILRTTSRRKWPTCRMRTSSRSTPA